MTRTAAATGLLALLLLMAPVPTLAASKATFFGPIVPAECKCNDQQVVGGSGTVNTAPDYGCVLQVIQNVINFAVSFSTILFTLYIVIAGFGLITSRGNPEAVSKARTRLTNVIIGLAVLLCSWLIIDFVMKKLYDDGKFGPWNGILAGDTSGNDRCIVAKQPKALTSGLLDVITGQGDGTGGTGGTVSTDGSGAQGTSGLNVQAASNYLISKYGSKTSSGHHCLAAIQLALQASGGGSLLCPGSGTSHYAGTCGPVLVSKGYASLGSSNPSPKVGDIIVVPSNRYSSIGHIAMYTSQGWISDFAQGGNGNPYPSPQPPAQYYRP